jgi:hypothetical protein
MKIFFGAAIQAHKEFGERRAVYRHILSTLKNLGASICTEHTTGETREEIIAMQEKAIGPTPPAGPARTRYVRDKLIGFIEGDIDAAVFEVSTPSLGTGVELTHAYLRKRLGLKPIPVLALYERDFWLNNLSTMIKGLSEESAGDFRLVEYKGYDELTQALRHFIDVIKRACA